MDEKSKHFNENGIYVAADLFSNSEVSDLKINFLLLFILFYKINEFKVYFKNLINYLANYQF